ncbi:MAG: glycosyltransferase [Candidatus Colwellbacteria bacterium]|nr:glycosyltransferase [Candidatus Colwellbacteria bacterium]
MPFRFRPPKIRRPRIFKRKGVGKPEIIIGIPSYNEAENIGILTQILDQGLIRYFPNKRALIINVDNNSSDGTKKAFLSTKTKTPKRYISTAPGVKGKGRNIKNLLEYFLNTESAAALMTIDADVTAVDPKWVKNLLTPIFKGFDHCLPIYRRSEDDGSITNHLAYPIVRGILGVEIRQPISGQTALSRKAADRIYNRPWPNCAYGFGIDALMTLSSVFGELKLCQAYLGTIHHKPVKLEDPLLFNEVAASLFSLLNVQKQLWQWSTPMRVRRPPVFFEANHGSEAPKMGIAYRELKEIVLAEFSKYRKEIEAIVGKDVFGYLSQNFGKGGDLNIDAEHWAAILSCFIKNSRTHHLKRAKFLRPLYLGRFLTFYKDSLDKSRERIEEAILAQAALIFKERKKFIDFPKV